MPCAAHQTHQVNHLQSFYLEPGTVWFLLFHRTFILGWMYCNLIYDDLEVSSRNLNFDHCAKIGHNWERREKQFLGIEVVDDVEHLG